MPETLFPIRTDRRLRRSTPLLTLLTALALGGCSGGDFGRTRADVRNDDMHRWLGAEATASVGLQASQFQLTDNERQLRDLAYPLIEPPHSRPAWKSVFGDYQPLPSPWRQAPLFDRIHGSRKRRREYLVSFAPAGLEPTAAAECSRLRNGVLEILQRKWGWFFCVAHNSMPCFLLYLKIA